MKMRDNGWLIIGNTEASERIRVGNKMKILGIPICLVDLYSSSPCDKTKKYLEAIVRCDGIIIAESGKDWNDYHDIRWVTFYNIAKDMGLPMRREQDLDMEIINAKMDEVHNDISKRVKKEIPKDCPPESYSDLIDRIIMGYKASKRSEKLKDEGYDNVQREVPENYPLGSCGCDPNFINGVGIPTGSGGNEPCVPVDGSKSDGTSGEFDTRLQRATAAAIYEFCRAFLGDDERRNDAGCSNCPGRGRESGSGWDETCCGCCSEPDGHFKLSE